MLNIEPKKQAILRGVNRLTTDVISRDGSYESSLYDSEGNKLPLEFILLKRVYNGDGIYTKLSNYWKKLCMKTPYLAKWDYADVLNKLDEELFKVEDFKPEFKLTIEQYIAITVLRKNVVKSMGKGRSFDPSRNSATFTTENEQDIENGEVSTEFLMWKTGIYNNLFSTPEDSMENRRIEKEARKELVKGLNTLYRVQLASSSKTDETIVSNLLRLIQEHDAQSHIRQGAEEVERIVGSLPANLKPDNRVDKLHSKAINKEGNDSTYHSRKSLTSIFKDYCTGENGGPFRMALIQIARSCETLNIPIPLIDAELVMTANYINKLFSALNGVYTANLTEYDIKEFEQNSNIASTFAEAVRLKVKTIKYRGSTLPDSKLSLAITPEVLNEIRELKLEDINQFSNFVVDSAQRGVEIWKESNEEKNAIKTTKKDVLKSGGKIKEAQRKEILRSAVSFANVKHGKNVRLKKGPAHTDTVIFTNEKIQDYERNIMLEIDGIFKLREMRKAREEFINIVMNKLSGYQISIKNRFLYNDTLQEYVTYTVSDKPFNSKKNQKSDVIYDDYLIRSDGYLVANYISVYFEGDEVQYLCRLKSEYEGIQILTYSGELVYRE